MPPKGSGKPKGKRKSAGNSARVQEEAAAALAAAASTTSTASTAPPASTAAAAGGAPPAIAAGYHLGARVEYRSATLRGWARAEVTAINAEDGTVSVQTLGVLGNWANTRSKGGLVPDGANLRVAGSVAGAQLVAGYENAEDRRKRLHRENRRACYGRAGQLDAGGPDDVATPAARGAAATSAGATFNRSVLAQDRMLRRDANDLVARVQAGNTKRSPQQQEQAMALAAEREPTLFAPATEAAIARDPHYIVGKLFGETMGQLKERKAAASTGNASRPGNAETTHGVAQVCSYIQWLFFCIRTHTHTHTHTYRHGKQRNVTCSYLISVHQ